MRKVREVLRLKYEQTLSNRAIATSCRISVGSVHDYIQRARTAKLSWPLPDGLIDEELDKRLFPIISSLPAERPLPDWEKVAIELRRKGVTLSLLWEEYRSSFSSGYGYSHFCDMFREYVTAVDPRMHQVHIAGEKLFVDYNGMTMRVIARLTGEFREVQVFVAAL